MSNIRWIYKIFIYCFVSITIGVHRIVADSNELFCDKLANAKETPYFSFDSLLGLQMFTFESYQDIVMVADGIRYVLNADELEYGNFESIVIPMNVIHKPWLSDQFKNPPDSIGKIASIARLVSDERLEMGYKIGAGVDRFVMLVSNKNIFVYSASGGSSENSRLLLSMDREGTKFSIVHDQIDQNSTAYVISRVPGDNGLMIYSLKLRSTPNADKIEADCQVIVNSECMKKRKFFYLLRGFVPMQARLEHAEKGNAKLANQVPLAELPPIGFIYMRKLFLFDVSLGCVYILDWNSPDFDDKFDTGYDIIPVPRKNIPFEEFFRCAQWPDDIELLPFLDKYRCDTTVKSSIVLGYLPNGPPGEKDIIDKIDANGNKISQSKWDGKTFAMFGAILFLVGLLVFAAITILNRGKSGQAKKVSESKIDPHDRRVVKLSSTNRTTKKKSRIDLAKRQSATSSTSTAVNSNAKGKSRHDLAKRQFDTSSTSSAAKSLRNQY